jgi:hypothetical protein
MKLNKEPGTTNPALAHVPGLFLIPALRGLLRKVRNLGDKHPNICTKTDILYRCFNVKSVSKHVQVHALAG